MSERPFPASARRIAEARAAGRIAWSPALVAGATMGGAAIAVAAMARAWAGAAERAIATGASATRAADPVSAATGVRASTIAADVVALVAPLLAIVAAAAVVAHVGQTRGLWIPRRQVRRLPPSEDGAGRRAGLAGLGLVRGIAVAIAGGGVLAAAAAVLAARVDAHAIGATGAVRTVGALGATLAASILAAAAAAAIAVALLDWLERARRIRADLAMSARELREEQRESHADPRWRRRARAVDDTAAVRTALVVLVADHRAVAIAWHARWQPVPRVSVAARGLAAARLAALARRHRVPVHRDVALATALADLGGRAVPAALHASMARVVVALQ